MDNRQIGSTNTTKLNFWGADTAEKEIKAIKGKLFAGHKISWMKLGIVRFIQACLSSDYVAFVEREFRIFENQQKPTLGNQIPTRAPDTSVLDSPQKPETPTTQKPIVASDNANLETTSKSDKLSKSIEIANTQIKETPSNALLTPIKLRISKNINLAGLDNIKKELDNIVELNPEISTDSLYKEIKAELESSIIEAERSFLDNRLKGEFTSANISPDAAHARKRVDDVIADTHKSFHGTIGEYRIKVISAIVTELLDEAKDSSKSLGDLNKRLSGLKTKMQDEILNVGEEEEDLDLLTEDPALAGKIDELLKNIETAEAEAKAKEAPAKEAAAKETAALETLKKKEEARTAISDIRRKMKSGNLDLETIKHIKEDLNAIIEANPEIKNDSRFEDTQIWIDRSIYSTERLRKENEEKLKEEKKI